MPKYQVSGLGVQAIIIEAKNERIARHVAMVMTYGDVSDKVVPRWKDLKDDLTLYSGHGLSVREV